jgi:integrase
MKHILTDRQCETAKPRPGKGTGILMLADGEGLYLMVRNIRGATCRSWVFRYAFRKSADDSHLATSTTGKKSTYKRQHLMGLGVYAPVGKTTGTVTLAEARAKAQEYRKLLQDGIDPLKHKRQAAAREAPKTFDECLAKFIEKSNWDPETEKQAESAFRRYVSPLIGKRWVADIDKADVIRVLEQPTDDGPFWTVMRPTAETLRGRIEGVLDLAEGRGWREGPNPARWKVLKHVLAAKSKDDEEHQPSLPFTRIYEFMVDLRSRQFVSTKSPKHFLGTRALEFLILTAVRRDEALDMLGEEIDFERKLWIIPAERMKMRREHRVPLCDRALELVSHAKPGELVFPIGDKYLGRLIEQMNADREKKELPRYIDPESGRDIVPHGFRATFETWAEERTAFPDKVIKAGLAHKKGDKTDEAYNRGDLFDRRRTLMDLWSQFVEMEESSADIHPLRSIA